MEGSYRGSGWESSMPPPPSPPTSFLFLEGKGEEGRGSAVPVCFPGGGGRNRAGWDETKGLSVSFASISYNRRETPAPGA